MSKYQEKERAKAIELIENSELFENCKAGGKFMGKERNFVLSDRNYNLFKPIRETAETYFNENAISFWGGKNLTPHTLSSQVACLNHLFPIRNSKNEVLKIAHIICEDIVDVLEIRSDKFLPAYIAFEVVSSNDYLNECEKEQKPNRGSHCTSIDVLIYAKHKNGKKYLLPIEWKYTEHYNNTDKSVEDRAGEPKGINGKWRERLNRYSELINNSKQLKKYDGYKSPKELLANIDKEKYADLKHYLEKRYW